MSSSSHSELTEPELVLIPDEPWTYDLCEEADLRWVRYSSRGVVPPEGAHARIVVAGLGDHEGTFRVVREHKPLRLLQTLYAGMEVWEGRVPEGVTVANARGARGAATAELAVTGILALLRGIPGYVAQQTERTWLSHTPAPTLMHKSVLIYGAGDIGRAVAAAVATFGAAPTLVGRSARRAVITREAAGHRLPHVDVVVLALPSTAETRGMVDKEFLASMKDGAMIVNVGRGVVLDTDALVAEVCTGRLQAFLDVTDPEPLPEDHPLWSAPGVLLTPHVGGSVVGAEQRGWTVALEQIRMWLRGQQPSNVVHF
jgi:phosphoglycerate dehydrogenase-like enzyme